MAVETLHTDVDEGYTLRLPKIELHAHLTGSISPATLHEIWQRRKALGEDLNLDDPLSVMSMEKGHFNVTTFFPLFDSYVYKLVDSVENIRFSTRAVLQSFLDDGVHYLELRTTPRYIATASISKDVYVDTVLQCIREFVAETRGIMSVYLILSIDRRQSAEEAQSTVETAVRCRDNGEPVVGVDLCGNPAKGDVSVFREAFEKARSAGLKITLHFAEIPASSTEVELNTLLSYHPDRLGHAIHVPRDCAEKIVAANIGLELCLSCNVLASMTDGGYVGHHFGQWKATGHPIVLGTDDVGVFGSPLSREYLLVAEHFGLTKADLVQMALSSCSMLFAGEGEKNRMERILNRFRDEESL